MAALHTRYTKWVSLAPTSRSRKKNVQGAVKGKSRRFGRLTRVTSGHVEFTVS